MTRRSPALVFVVLAALVAACGGASGQPTWSPLAVPPPTPASSPAASGEPGSAAPAGSPSASAGPSASPLPSGGAGEAVSVTIGTDTGAALQFDPAKVSVPAGATVRLTFENRSAGIPHNLTFGDPINKATATTVEAGASETLEFDAPDPGDYPFACTLHPGMEGVLTVAAP